MSPQMGRSLESNRKTIISWAAMDTEVSNRLEHAQTELTRRRGGVNSSVVAEAEHSGYAVGDLGWFRDWLLRMCWGDGIDTPTLEHFQSYENHSDGKRRQMFASTLEHVLPEATAAPLIIYRLYPRALRIATAVAFGDASRAREVRSEQISYLPVIGDCHQCDGRTLENGEICPDCGNPFWKIAWMNATE